MTEWDGETDMGKKRIIKAKRLYGNGEGSSPEFISDRFETEYSLVDELDRALSEIEGQDHALQAVKEYLFGVNSRENGTGTGGLLTFIGPPAVGKTRTAELIAKALHRPFLRLDMSAYNDHEAGLCDLFGLHKSYKAAQPGFLTSFVNDEPVCVILLDEFEKAHINVQNRFLQIFERGEVQDLYSEKFVSFRDAILIVTSNVGRRLYDRASVSYNLCRLPQETILHAMRSDLHPTTNQPYLSDALVSRLSSGRIILFNKLRPEVLLRIAEREIERQIGYYRQKFEIVIKAHRNLAKFIILSQGANADVRSVIKAIREFFEKNVERLVESKFAESAFCDFTSVKIAISSENSSKAARELFYAPHKIRVLVCCADAEREFFSRFCSDNVEIVFAENTQTPAAIADGDYSAAILDRAEEMRRFSKSLFYALTEQETVPVYVYDPFAKSVTKLYDYTDHGAVSVLPQANGKNLERWIKSVFAGMDLTWLSQTLYRSNRVLTFNTAYEFDESRTAVIKLFETDVKAAKRSDDLDSFVSAAQIPNVRFDDVYGAEEAKSELCRVLDVMKNYKKYLRLGIRLPRGILLEGDPGTGKTMLAKALACEADMPIIQKNASEFGQKYIGEGARLIRETFAATRRYAPAILYIDEIDTFAKIREGSSREWAIDILNAFLSEMDGFADNSDAPVYVVASTNLTSQRGETLLDPAFLRRFDRKIHIELPDLETRKKYLSDHLAKYPNEVTATMIEGIAKRSVGWSLGELNNVLQNALREAFGGTESTLSDALLNETFEKYADGESKRCDEKSLRRTAIHEAGHAVAAALLGVAPSYATIKGRGKYGGYVYYGDESITELSREECLNRICISMAGRAAETLFYGDRGISTGASGDLKSATNLATSMLCDYGMDEENPIFVEPSKRLETPWVTEKAVRLIKEQSSRARGLIEKNRGKVDRVAEALLDKTSLDEAELRRLINE